MQNANVVARQTHRVYNLNYFRDRSHSSDFVMSSSASLPTSSSSSASSSGEPTTVPVVGIARETTSSSTSTSTSTTNSNSSGSSSNKKKRKRPSKSTLVRSDLSPRSSRKRSTEIMDKFRKEAEDKALDILEKFIPTKIIELGKACSEMRVFNTPLEEIVIGLPQIKMQSAPGDASAPKLQADDGLSSDTDGGSGDDIDLSTADDGMGGDKAKKLPLTRKCVEIPSNPVIVEMGDFLKKEVKEGVQALSAIKLWIQLMVPRIEDGNNFGVEVQEEVSSEVDRCETMCLQLLQNLAKYFRERSKIAENWSAHENIDDFRQAMIERDKLQHFTLRLFLHDLRDNYATLHDLVQKNLEKIVRPKGDGAADSGMMMMMM